MIDVKKAVSVAIEYFADLYADQHFSNVLLEEVEDNEDENAWLITLGYSPPQTALESVQDSLSPLSRVSAFTTRDRQYKSVYDRGPFWKRALHEDPYLRAYGSRFRPFAFI